MAKRYCSERIGALATGKAKKVPWGQTLRQGWPHAPRKKRNRRKGTAADLESCVVAQGSDWSPSWANGTNYRLPDSPIWQFHGCRPHSGGNRSPAGAGARINPRSRSAWTQQKGQAFLSAPIYPLARCGIPAGPFCHL